jgi:hypothetical protein
MWPAGEKCMTKKLELNIDLFKKLDIVLKLVQFVTGRYLILLLFSKISIYIYIYIVSGHTNLCNVYWKIWNNDLMWCIYNVCNIIKRGWNSGNSCDHSIQNIVSYRLLSRNVKIILCKTAILPVLLYGCETWCLNLREEDTQWLRTGCWGEYFG